MPDINLNQLVVGKGGLPRSLSSLYQLRRSRGPRDVNSRVVNREFGVTLDLPVRNKNQGAIEAAVAESEAAKSRREFAELTIRREVASAYAQYERNTRAMEIFRVGAVEQAKNNLDVIRQTYELGSKTLIDYLGEQRRYIDLENDFIDAQLAVYNSRVDIARSTASLELIKR